MSGGSLKVPTTVYYIITHYGRPCVETAALPRRSNAGFGVTDSANKATRFATMSGALDRLAQSHSSPGWGITRVEETPAGPSTVRLVSTTNIDARKPVVLYNRDNGAYGRINNDKALVNALSLSDATVFPDLSDAIEANTKAMLATQSRYGSVKIPVIEVRQVEGVPGSPIITETVLK